MIVFIKQHRGALALLLITLIASLATGIICNAFGAGRLTSIVSAQMAGALSMLIIGWLFDLCHLKPPMRADGGILGIMLGTIISLIAF